MYVGNINKKLKYVIYLMLKYKIYNLMYILVYLKPLIINICFFYFLLYLSLPAGVHVGRSNIKSVAEKRLPLIQRFLKSLFDAAEEIAHSDLVYTFFHPLLRDQQEAKLEMPKIKGEFSKELKQFIMISL